MYFSVRQWLLGIVLEVLIKTVLIFLVTVFVTFGGAPVSVGVLNLRFSRHEVT